MKTPEEIRRAFEMQDVDDEQVGVAGIGLRRMGIDSP